MDTITLLDKKNILSNIDGLTMVKLELGCGEHKKIPDAIGIDALDYPGVDIVGDIFEVLRAFPAASVDAIYSFHFFEHIADLSALLDEMSRVLKTGGKLEVVVPHFSNPYFYSDPTHKTFFGLYTFCYFSRNTLFSRQVPTYGKEIKFELVAADLIFKSSRPFVVRHGIKKLLGKVFNCCIYMKEFYEENLCHLFPCYEIKYQLRKTGAASP
jgi:ubiquinone/menaquinone biosynthesis C-methylase UbiE